MHTNKSRLTIGSPEDSDYELAILDHVSQYRDSAPELSEILMSSAIAVQHEEFKRNDEEAIEAQRLFMKTSNKALLGALFSSVFGAFLVGSSAAFTFFAIDNLMSKSMTLGLTLLSMLAAGITFWAINYLQSAELLTKWMTKRATAESYRLGLFETIGDEAMSRKNKVTASDAVAYIERYQLDVQLNYYRARGKQHSRVADKFLKYNLLAITVVFIVNGMAGFSGIFIHAFASFTLIALVAQSVSSYYSNLGSINQDRRNAERYERTYSALMKVKSSVDDVQKEIANGNFSVLQTFVDAVDESISNEHRQWLDNFDKRHSAIGRLQEALSSQESNTAPSSPVILDVIK